MRYASSIDHDPIEVELRLKEKISDLLDENRRLVEEIRALRCTMVEAASSINPKYEPKLFAHLSGKPNHFVTYDNNPYPEHDDHVSAQYMDFLTREAQKLGQY